MAVTHTDSCHARKQVQVSLPINIPQPLHVALVNEHRVFVGGSFHYHGVAVLSADLQHSLFRHTLNNTCQTGKVSLCHQCVCVGGGHTHTCDVLNQCYRATLYSSGLKLHGGMSGMFVLE